MRRRRRLHFLVRNVARRAFVGVALIAYLAAAIGHPVVLHPRKDLSKPFPCQDRPCGCTSAEDSEHHCCCFTREERQAWFEAHAADRATEEIVERTEEPSAEKCPHCAKTEKRSDCCQTEKYSPAEERSSQACCAQPKESTCCQAAALDVRWVVTLEQKNCQGIAHFWTQSGAVVAPPLPVVLAREERAPVWLKLFTESFPSHPSSPPVPPPRLSF